MKIYIFTLIVAAGISAVFLPIKQTPQQTIAPRQLPPPNIVETEFRASLPVSNQGKGDLQQENNDQTTPETECLGPCLERILSALISGGPLTNSEKRRLRSNPEFLAHYLKYNPQFMIDAAHLISDHTPKDIGDLGYDESLEDRAIILDSIITRMPIDELARMASTLIHSDKKSDRTAGLTFIERAYVDRSETEMRGKKPVITDILRHLSTSDKDPQIQLQAIDILSYESSEHVDDQIINILTNLATRSESPKIKGDALKMAAYHTQSKSVAMSQISLELTNPTSKIQLPALRAMQIIYSHSNADDTEIRARLQQLKPVLETYMRHPNTNGEAKRLAENLYKGLSKDSDR